MGRILAEDVTVKQDIPSFDRSVVDGFAVRSADIRNASLYNPTVLRVIGESKLGQKCSINLGRSNAIAVATGSIVPRGGDSVVPKENIVYVSKQRISITSPLGHGQNILRKGEDFPRGKVILERDRRLRPEDLGLLKLLGFTRVRVLQQPRVGVMSTGSELVERVGQSCMGAKTVDINRTILSAMVSACDGKVVDFGIVRDDRVSIIHALMKAIRSCNLILVSGGSSVGQRDLVPECVNALGRPGMLVHGVAMRPAMPTGLAAVNNVPIIVLPGFPVSAMFAFLVFGRPMIAKIIGTKNVIERTTKAILTETVKGGRGYRTFVRVKLRRIKGRFVAKPLKNQKSSALASMIAADAYLVIPEDANEIRANEKLQVTMLR
jgi:molybdopterin molybdotransferase